jgi:pyruvate ferredoxin oxidoreductase gamma subunit
VFRIRFHGRGGQGMKTASRILGSAFFAAGYEVQDAPRYGAERRGAPIFAYVRAAHAPIAERGVITRPDLVVVADETLVGVPAAGVLKGVGEGCVLLIDSHEDAATWRERLNTPAQVLILPVSEEVTDRTELRYVGAACAGAAARLCGVVPAEALSRAIREELGGLGEAVVARNLEKALAAFEAMDGHAGTVTPGAEVDAGGYRAPEWVQVPFEDATISAPIIRGGVTSELAKTGLWRTMRPVIDYRRCNRCWWVCSSLCPDGAIRVEEGRPVIDLDHCKGCLVCVAVCPPHAIEAVDEHQAAAGEAG